MIKVLLADHQPLTAAGLSSILRDHNDFSVVGLVQSRLDFHPQLSAYRPHVLVVDPCLTDYVSKEDLSRVKESSPETHMLVVSADTDKESIFEILQAGVIGYLTKDCGRDEIIRAIYAVARGEKFYCHKILDVIMEKHFSPVATDASSGVLTAREREILKYLASGYSTQKVADHLHLSPHTVHTHRKSIIKKLAIKSPTEFVIHAIDFGLIKPNRF